MRNASLSIVAAAASSASMELARGEDAAGVGGSVHMRRVSSARGVFALLFLTLVGGLPGILRGARVCSVRGSAGGVAWCGAGGTVDVDALAGARDFRCTRSSGREGRGTSVTERFGCGARSRGDGGQYADCDRRGAPSLRTRTKEWRGRSVDSWTASARALLGGSLGRTASALASSSDTRSASGVGSGMIVV